MKIFNRTSHIESLYRVMLRIRRVEEAIAERYAKQEMRCPVHLSIGQEAVATGVCAALARQDGVFSSHRSHAHYLAKGGSLTAMLAEIYGKAEGCCKGMGGSMHLIDLGAGFLGSVPIVGATVPLAVGAAWAAKLRGEKRIIAVFFGDGTFEEGAVYESINFAVLRRLPILFVCENNLYSCYTPLSARQPARSIHGVAAACGCKTLAVDGNDVLAVLDAANIAVADLRVGGQPVFMECSTYRWREHCGPNVDDNLGYRPAAEIAKWKAACPVNRLAATLQASPEGEKFLSKVEREITEEIDAAFVQAQAGSNPQPSDLPEYLYAR